MCDFFAKILENEKLTILFQTLGATSRPTVPRLGLYVLVVLHCPWYIQLMKRKENQDFKNYNKSLQSITVVRIHWFNLQFQILSNAITQLHYFNLFTCTLHAIGVNDNYNYLCQTFYLFYFFILTSLQISRNTMIVAPQSVSLHKVTILNILRTNITTNC